MHYVKMESKHLNIWDKRWLGRKLDFLYHISVVIAANRMFETDTTHFKIDEGKSSTFFQFVPCHINQEKSQSFGFYTLRACTQ